MERGTPSKSATRSSPVEAEDWTGENVGASTEEESFHSHSLCAELYTERNRECNRRRAAAASPPPFLILKVHWVQPKPEPTLTSLALSQPAQAASKGEASPAQALLAAANGYCTLAPLLYIAGIQSGLDKRNNLLHLLCKKGFCRAFLHYLFCK